MLSYMSGISRNLFFYVVAELRETFTKNNTEKNDLKRNDPS